MTQEGGAQRLILRVGTIWVRVTVAGALGEAAQRGQGGVQSWRKR